MPTPARRVTSSTETPTPSPANSSLAAATMRSRFRCASRRRAMQAVWHKAERALRFCVDFQDEPIEREAVEPEPDAGRALERRDRLRRAELGGRPRAADDPAQPPYVGDGRHVAAHGLP